jgi:hypothetical protein
MPSTRDVPKQKPQQKPIPSGDRGYGGGTRDVQPQQRPSSQPRPTSRPTSSGGNKSTAMSGAGGSRQSANAASQRGKQSMPQGARSKGSGSGKNRQAR